MNVFPIHVIFDKFGLKNIKTIYLTYKNALLTLKKILD